RRSRRVDSCGNLYPAVQEFRSKVSSVRPDDRVQFGMQVKCPKHVEIAERFEDWTIQLVSQVDLAGRTVAEANPDHVAMSMASLDQPNHLCPPDSLQRVDWPERLAIPRKLPVLFELWPVSRIPF